MELNFNNMTGLILRRTALEAESKIKPLNGIYDEHQKLVFLFDCSGSMSSLIARSYETQYNWSEETMTKIRLAAEDAYLRRAEVDAVPDELTRSLALMHLGGKVIEMASWCDSTGRALPDLDLQQRVIRNNMLLDFGVSVNWEDHDQKPPTRTEVVKTLAKSELAKRIARYPKSALTVLRFGSSAQVLYEEGMDETQLWRAVDGLDNADGGTDILSAVAAGMEACRRRPSKVNVHHFILVTDGEWWGDLISWVPSLKASGVILDYIHIGDCAPNQQIAEVCKATGGEYALVNSEKSLREKFVEAVQRKCLPPAK